ncbi:MAG: DUF177 domain-containing protein [Proteobacteria bacterium]|nr:DUF177 domain-containing protein [Pseudomonadota bacterium]
MTPEITFMADIPALAKSTKSLRITASGRERKALAKRIEVPELLAFEATFDAQKKGGGIYLVTGRVKARMKQTCVRTLDVIETSLDQPFSVRFMDENIFAAYQHEELRGEIGDHELLTGESVNLGEVAAQYLSLFVDPYPAGEGAPGEKDPGAQARFRSGDNRGEGANPFAILKKLDKKG